MNFLLEGKITKFYYEKWSEFNKRLEPFSNLGNNQNSFEITDTDISIEKTIEALENICKQIKEDLNDKIINSIQKVGVLDFTIEGIKFNFKDSQKGKYISIKDNKKYTFQDVVMGPEYEIEYE